MEANAIPHGDDEWEIGLGVKVIFLRDGHGLIEESQFNGNHQSHSLFLESSRTLSYPISKVMGLFIYFFDSINNLYLKMSLCVAIFLIVEHKMKHNIPKLFTYGATSYGFFLIIVHKM